MVTTTPTERTTELDRFIWLFNNCQTRVGIPANVDPTANTKHAVFEDAVQTTDTRPLTTDDVKVTVKWSTNVHNNQLAHLSQIENQPYYKLGIRFERWRQIDPEQKLVTLGHELGHTRYPHHKQSYWSFVIDIWQSMLTQKSPLESWFDTTINWDYTRSCMINDVYNNTSSENRTDLMEWAGEQLEYQPEWTTTLDWGRGINHTTTHWPREKRHYIAGQRITLSRIYSDKELVEFKNTLETTTDVHKLPIITGTLNRNGSVTITQNEIAAALCLRTHRKPRIPVVLKHA